MAQSIRAFIPRLIALAFVTTALSGCWWGVRRGEPRHEEHHEEHHDDHRR